MKPKGGNLLEIRGLAGTSIDDAIHAGILEGVQAHPDFKMRGRPFTGDWDQTTAQKAVATVLPSLPPIVGVVDQGGDGYGAAQAFAAAGKLRTRPSLRVTARTNWSGGSSRRKRTAIRPGRRPYAPGVSTLAFWVAQQVLEGNKNVPHDLLVPYLAFTQDDFEKELPNIQKGGVASHEYTQADAIAAIKANMK